MQQSNESEFFTKKTLAEYFGVTMSSVSKWRKTGYGPVGFKVGKHVRYRRSDVEKWIDDQAARESAACGGHGQDG